MTRLSRRINYEGSRSGLMRRVTSPSLLCWLLSFAILSALGGCSTTTSSDVYNEDLQEKIRKEHLIKKGDYVIIHTLDNVKYEFTVNSIDEERIKGEDISVQIDDIAGLKTKSFSIGKTVGLVSGIGVGLWCAYISLATSSIGCYFFF
jgi:hypothetical protein